MKLKIFDALFLPVMLSLLIYGCSTINLGKLSPEYPGVDPAIAPYVNKWLDLAAEKGLKFDHKVTIGFRNIRSGRIIGLCNYGFDFREIDIDAQYWNRASEESRQSLVSHELTHCYCGRDHDYGDGKPYGDAEKAYNDPKKADGFFDDLCPRSIMFPQVLEDYCAEIHYEEYKKEMFNRCDEY